MGGRGAFSTSHPKMLKSVLQFLFPRKNMGKSLENLTIYIMLNIKTKAHFCTIREIMYIK